MRRAATSATTGSIAQEADRRVGRGGAAEADVGGVERRLRADARAAPSAAWCSELRDCRNKWAHQEPFSSDDADRALDSAARLLTAVSAPQADEVEKMKMELLRADASTSRCAARSARAAARPIESAATGSLKPWREVVTPHADVASGRYQQAEFAADLWQVHLGEGTDEYRKPGRVLPPHLPHREPEAAARGRACSASPGKGGDPVVQLQTNFGGGKTHSMLALYHLFSGVAPERAGRRRRGACRRRA